MAMKQVEDLDKLQRSDHDTITRLEVKMDTLIKGQEMMSSSLDGKIVDHESRINKLEAIVESVQPEKTINEFRLLQQQVRDFVTTANVFRVISGIVGGGVVFLLTQLPNWIRLGIFSK